MKLNRTLYRVVLIVSFLILNACILMGISAVFSYLNTGAERSSILHLPEELSSNYLPIVTWASLNNEGRPMEKQTLAEIERDYLKAWYVRTIALETNTKYGIADYYTDSARVQLYDIIDFNKRNNTHFKSTTLAHHPKLEFYSADGKIVVLTDENVVLYEEVYKNKTRIAKKQETASYQIMLLLEDGFWRIRHMVKLPSTQEEKTTLPDFDMNDIAHSKGINYYPQKTPWNMYGEHFNDSIIDTDFKKIHALGLNTVRIFVPYVGFGKAEVDTAKISQLKTTFDLAAKNDLKVIATLFDFYGDYSLRDWTFTHRHAEGIVSALKSHQALLAWDIKNEPDLDFEARGKENVMSWLQQMITQIKSWDTKHPVTIGWSSTIAAENLANNVDFVSFHYYLKPDKFMAAFHQLKSKVADKPLVLQEYGYSSYDGIWNAYLGSDEDQAGYCQEMQSHIKKEAIPYILWTLYDFETVPDAVVGKLPWRKANQKHFGLIGTENTHKAAYSILKKK